MLDSIEPKNKTEKGKARGSELDTKKGAVKYTRVHEDEYDDDDEAVLAIEDSEEDDEDEEVATKKPNKKQRKRTHSIQKEGSKQKRRKSSVNEEDIALDYMEKFKQIYENKFNYSIKNLSQDISFINKVKFDFFLYLQ